MVLLKYYFADSLPLHCSATGLPNVRDCFVQSTRAHGRLIQRGMPGSGSCTSQHEAHLWPRVARHQTHQLQRLPFADGVHSLRVALLLNVAGQARMVNPHCGWGCGRNQKEWIKKRTDQGRPRGTSASPTSPTLQDLLMQSCLIDR